MSPTHLNVGWIYRLCPNNKGYGKGKSKITLEQRNLVSIPVNSINYHQCFFPTS